MEPRVNCVVAGCGVIGLAIARALSRSGLETIALESNKIAMNETSSRNSEVIHAGLYYPHKSMKAVHCLAGSKQLYGYLKERQVPFNQCGKLLVCTDISTLPKLKALHAHAEGNGVEGMQLLTGDDVKNHFEPTVHCTNALWVPSTGVFNSHAFADCLQAESEDHGATFIFNCHVSGVSRIADSSMLNPGASSSTAASSSGWKVSTNQGDINCDAFINATGLHAPFTAKSIVDYPVERVPSAFYCKGSYFKCNNSNVKLSHLVYPLPSGGGLGVHATIDVSGAVKFGPNAEWLVEKGKEQFDEKTTGDSKYLHSISAPAGLEAYRVNESLRNVFVSEINKYLPHLQADWIDPDYAGIRPKLVGPRHTLPVDKYGRELTDFVIEGSVEHGLRGLVNLFGIESPGLTASLSIGEYVRDLVLKDKLSS